MSKCSHARSLVLLSCCLWSFCRLVSAGETDREADALFLDFDSGVEVVLDAQEGEFSRQDDVSGRESTEDKLQSFMDAGEFMLGWDDSEEKRVFLLMESVSSMSKTHPLTQPSLNGVSLPLSKLFFAPSRMSLPLFFLPISRLRSA